MQNNPVRFNDPTGHVCTDPEDPNSTCYGSASAQTKVGDKMIRGNDAELRKLSVTKPKRQHFPQPCTTCHVPTATSTPLPTLTPSATSTPCPQVAQACLPTAISTPSPTSILTFTSTPEYTIGPNNNPAWEFPYAIGVENPVDFTIDIAGLIGDAASFLGAPGKIVWVLTEGGELVGIGKDVYDLAVNEDLSGISSTIFFDAAEKLAPDIMRMKNPGIISVAGNLWSISQNITITPK